MTDAVGAGQAWRGNPLSVRLLTLIALCWSLFQLWIASPLPYALGWGVVSETEARSVHLAFALLLAFALYPGRRGRSGPATGMPLLSLLLLGSALVLLLFSAWALFAGTAWMPWLALSATCLLIGCSQLTSGASRLPRLDVLLGLVAALTALYLFWQHAALADRPGRPLTMDLVVSVVGLALLLEATRRSLGPALSLIAGLFLAFAFLGPWLPDLLAHRGASLSRAASQYWLSGEGVFGIALGVSTSFVFLFVLFGALLERAGAGRYFIQVSFALLGHLRGGPAKAAVVASGLTGMISGSSIANTVTTGTFTIPLMKRVGLSGNRAGAVEVASSVNGQLMPPVMGAAAFLMVEYVGIPYIEVIRHAFLPAAIAYIALLYIVHLEALKTGVRGLPARPEADWRGRLIGTGLVVSGLIVVAGLLTLLLRWLEPMAAAVSTLVLAGGLLLLYLGLLWLAARQPMVEFDEDRELPPLGPTIKRGLHFLLPILVLVWALVIERLSPAVSAFWAVMLLVLICLSQRPLLALMGRQRQRLAALSRAGMCDLHDGLVLGARNMVGIGVATATAGIIVGTVSMTGLGLGLSQVVEALSGGNLFLMLVLVALLSLVLGLGLPTTANYIIVASLMAPIVVELGADAGLIVPLIAVHLFVFYFGIMADLTPPVGLATFAAAGISRGDPVMTGVHALRYSLRMIVLPFIFIFNTQLLLIGIDSGLQLALVVVSATAAMLLFAAASQGYWLVANRWYETPALLLVAFTLLYPGFWMDRLTEPWEQRPVSELTEQIERTADGDHLRLRFRGLDADGREVVRPAMLPLGAGDDAAARLQGAGLTLDRENGPLEVIDVEHGSVAERAGIDYGWQVEAVLVPSARPSENWFLLPAIALLSVIGFAQWRRRRQEAVSDPQSRRRLDPERR
ncbi:TRAP transporter permease [Methylonatrum kenyense]|uniref:TRAP transporter permease n=1 Tax=Methylonatrum kenyense TaxID=455253 RepID=UPI0020BDBD7A|nr:TRAP transporter permease [Methylonatrum kenyense]MCK8515608.1 TRAP transporter permease [Methylonatrum kenyense]